MDNGNNSLSSTDFANAVFGGVEILSTNTIPLDEIENKKQNATIFNNCADQIFSTLSQYGYDATFLTSSISPGHSKHVKHDKKHAAQVFYCRRCLKLSDNPDECYGYVIAAAAFKYVKDVENDVCYVKANVQHVFPHSDQCDLPLCERRNHMMDAACGGSGYLTITFPTELLMKEPWEDVVDHLVDSGESCGEFGTKIDNNTDSYNSEFVYDERYYMKLADLKMTGIDLTVYRQKHNQLLKRLILLFANTMNIGREICGCNYTDEIQILNPDNNSKYKAVTTSFGTDSETFPSPHLSFELPTIIYGGKQAATYLTRTNQITHRDLIKCDITDGSRDEYEVTDNPNLKDLFKPGSILIPLTPKGRRIQIGGTIQTIQYRQAIFFQGDCSHAGYTIPCNEYDHCNPALHLYLMSTNHPVDPNNFAIDLDYVRLHQPQLLNLIHPDNAVDACRKNKEDIITAFESAISHEKSDLEKLAVIVEELKLTLGMLSLRCEKELKQRQIDYKKERSGKRTRR